MLLLLLIHCGHWTPNEKCYHVSCVDLSRTRLQQYEPDGPVQVRIAYTVDVDCTILSPLSSDRQHLSYDVCLEVRGEIIGTVLFCIVY